MGLLTRKDLVKRVPFKIEKVDLGDDTFVYVREMSARNRDLFDMSQVKAVKNEKTGDIEKYDLDTADYRAKLAVVTRICVPLSFKRKFIRSGGYSGSMGK